MYHGNRYFHRITVLHYYFLSSRFYYLSKLFLVRGENREICSQNCFVFSRMTIITYWFVFCFLSKLSISSCQEFAISPPSIDPEILIIKFYAACGLCHELGHICWLFCSCGEVVYSGEIGLG